MTFQLVPSSILIASVSINGKMYTKLGSMRTFHGNKYLGYKTHSSQCKSVHWPFDCRADCIIMVCWCYLHSSMAVVETCPINFIIRYGVAKIKLKNVRIGQAETFFGGPSATDGSCVPFAAAENISLKRAVDGSTLLKPSKYNNLKRRHRNTIEVH